MDYEKLTDEELKQKLEELNTQFLGYQEIFTEAYNNMVMLGEENDKIKKILNSRQNG